MYELSSKAIEDIEGVIDYTVKNFGYDGMLVYHQSLDKCFQTLSKNPDIGLNYDHVVLVIFVFIINLTQFFIKRKAVIFLSFAYCTKVWML